MSGYRVEPIPRKLIAQYDCVGVGPNVIWFWFPEPELDEWLNENVEDNDIEFGVDFNGPGGREFIAFATEEDALKFKLAWL